MVHDYDSCDHPAHRPRYVFADTVIIFVMFPIHMVFVGHFCHQLWLNKDTMKRNPLIIPILGYIVNSVITLFQAFLIFVFVPVIQSQSRLTMPACQSLEFIGRCAASICYLAMIEVFMIRLDMSFKGSVFEIEHYTRIILRTVIYVNWLVTNVFFAIRIGFFHCWQHYDTGPIGRLPFYVRTSYWCEGDKNQALEIPITIAGMIIAGLNVTLLWMFIRRLRELSTTDFNGLIEKSVVVCVAGILSTLVGFAIMTATGILTLIIFDLSFNCLLLYTLLEFGKDVYDWLFGRIVIWLRTRFQGYTPPEQREPPRQIASPTLSEIDDDFDKSFDHFDKPNTPVT